ncbi:MAG: extracellular solute-binding protein [Anaerolineae bacterium]
MSLFRRVFQKTGRAAGSFSATMMALTVMTAACTSLMLPDNAPTLTQFPTGAAETAERTPEGGSAAGQTVALIATAPIVDQLSGTPTGIPAAAPITLRVWLPESLAPVENGNAAELLSEQISGFLSLNPDVLLDLRLKRPSDVGGILSTLRTASIVAPDALPDLTLMRRADLVSAVQGGYLETLDDRLPVGFFDAFDVRVAGLGRMEDRQYGVPFTLDLLHTAYNPTRTPNVESWSFQAMLDQQVHFAFTANRAGMLNDTVLLQLIAAGMEISPDGMLNVDSAALQSIFTYYQNAVAQDLITPDVLTYVDPSAYADALLTGETVGVISARQYRQWIAQGESLAAGYIPTLDGTPITLLDGWMWVLVTADSRRQEAAARFLAWMFDPERQQAYTDAAGVIPSQQSALDLWDDTAYADFLESLLPNAVYPPDSNSAAAARLVQTEFAAVINGSESPGSAAQSLSTQLARP